MIYTDVGMTDVYFFTETKKLPLALDRLGISDFKGARLPIKLHMGEPGNRYYISPSLVKLAVDKLKEAGAEPFLFDTTVAYPTPRANKAGYEDIAYRHGFRKKDMGCEVVIGEEGVEVVEGGQSFQVARQIYESTHLMVMSHVKGHLLAGFGGAIKNLGMGGVTKDSKRMIHSMSLPRHSPDKCNHCGSCAEVCPDQAITVDPEWEKTNCPGCGKCVAACPTGALTYEVMDLQRGLALSAKACILEKRVIYINTLINITRNCDCVPDPGSIICPDIGYLASSELAAIDRASLDMINEVKPDLFLEHNGVDPARQVNYAQEIGLASDYQLVTL